MPLDSAAMFKGTAKNLFHSLFDSLDSKVLLFLHPDLFFYHTT